MKKSHLILVIVGIMLIASASIFAAEPAKETTKAAPKQLKPQSLCPVMGGKIDSTVFADLQGQRVYFCCGKCPPKFKADPDTYFKKVAEQGVLFENVQTTCPVSGEKLENKSIFVDYQGRRIDFCCKKCVADFEKDPKKYLSMMDKPAAPATKPEKM